MESSGSTPSFSQWCNLPSDILLLISKKLHGKYDRQLGAVYNSWNSSFPSKPPSNFPLEIPCPVIPTLEDEKEHVISFSKRFKFYIVQRSVVLISPLKKEVDTPAAWIANVEENGVKEKSFFNPLTGNRISPCSCRKYLNKNVTSLFPKCINLLDCCVTDITKAYSILWVDMEDCYHTHSCSPPELSGFLHIKKVITFDVDGEGIIVLMALLNDGELAFWNSGCQEWKMVDSFFKQEMSMFVDILCFDGKLCVVDMQGNLVMIDPLTVKPIKIVFAKQYMLYDHNIATYLVWCKEYLYLVRIVYFDEKLVDGWNEFEDTDLPLDMICFVLTEKGWVDNGGFGPKSNKVFFLGNDVTYSLSAKQLGWLRGNYGYYGGMMSPNYSYRFLSAKGFLFQNMRTDQSLKYNISIEDNGPFDGIYDYDDGSYIHLETKHHPHLAITKIFCPPPE